MESSEYGWNELFKYSFDLMHALARIARPLRTTSGQGPWAPSDMWAAGRRLGNWDMYEYHVVNPGSYGSLLDVDIPEYPEVREE